MSTFEWALSQLKVEIYFAFLEKWIFINIHKIDIHMPGEERRCDVAETDANVMCLRQCCSLASNVELGRNKTMSQEADSWIKRNDRHDNARMTEFRMW